MWYIFRHINGELNVISQVLFCFPHHSITIEVKSMFFLYFLFLLFYESGYTKMVHSKTKPSHLAPKDLWAIVHLKTVNYIRGLVYEKPHMHNVVIVMM